MDVTAVCSPGTVVNAPDEGETEAVLQATAWQLIAAAPFPVTPLAKATIGMAAPTTIAAPKTSHLRITHLLVGHCSDRIARDPPYQGDVRGRWQPAATNRTCEWYRLEAARESRPRHPQILVVLIDRSIHSLKECARWLSRESPANWAAQVPTAPRPGRRSRRRPFWLCGRRVSGEQARE